MNKLSPSYAPGRAARCPRSNPGPHVWSVVLAAGDGSRLAALTRDRRGSPVPKQFCSLQGQGTLLADALCRAMVVSADARRAAVVAKQHQAWWRPAMRSLPRENLFVQPQNKGTANGVLLAAAAIAAREPAAIAVFLPADHFVRDEWVLADALFEAAAAATASGELVMLGLEPDEPDPELGYIVGSAPGGHGAQRVRQFVEKPERHAAARLLAEGAVWNSFIFAVPVAALLALIRDRHPDVVEAFTAATLRGPSAVADLYTRLPPLDFSRDVLQGSEARLQVIRVPSCGWTDLGTPRRVVECVSRLPGRRPVRPRAFLPGAIDLSAVCARQQLLG